LPTLPINKRIDNQYSRYKKMVISKEWSDREILSINNRQRSLPSVEMTGMYKQSFCSGANWNKLPSSGRFDPQSTGVFVETMHELSLLF
jgi:hypothetical protein